MQSTKWIIILILFLGRAALAQPEIQNFSTYGGWFIDECYDHIQTSDGGYALIGHSRSFVEEPYKSDIWIVKTNDNGDSLWSRTYGWEYEEFGETWDYGWQIIENEDNGYLVFGNISWQIGWPPENFTKILVLSLDANGDSLWTKFYGTDKRDYAHTVIGTDDGGYAIAGYTTSLDEGNEGYFGRDFFLLRLDENCDSLWMQAYQQPSTNECKKVIQTSVGGFALAGKTGYFRNNSTSYQIIFTDENGDSLWSYVAESDGFDDDRCYTINEIVGDEPDQSLYILSGVKTIGNAPFGDMWTMAINTEGVRQWERFDGSDEFRMNEDQ